MRILFNADIRTANGYYRALGPMMALSRRGGFQIRQTDPEIDRSLLAQFDALLIHRFADADNVALARAADRAGLAVVWDNDDDFAAINRRMPAYRSYGGLRWERRRGDMQRIFELATLVTSPSRRLSEVHAELGARAVDIVPNRISERSIMRPQTRKGTVVIGWVAGGEHRFDVRELDFERTLARVLERVSYARVETVGLSLGALRERYDHSDSIPLQRLVERNATFDIGIAPIAELPLNASRSDIKVREYSAAGTPWLASPRGPYASLGPDQGGQLVADDEWEEALVALATDEKRRKKLSKAARKWAERETQERSIAEWERIFERAVTARQAA